MMIKNNSICISGYRFRPGFFLLPLLILLASSCRNLPPEGSRIWTAENDGLSWSLWVDRNAKAVLELPTSFKAEIHGEAFEEADGWIMHCDSLHFFINGPRGWTEANLALQGMILLNRSGGVWRMTTLETPEILNVEKAEIRYKREKIYGDRAADMTSRRLVRSEAVALFLNEYLSDVDYTFQHKKKGYWSDSYMIDMEMLLFPEVYGYGEANPLPVSDTPDEERFERHEEILWDKAYSEAYIPEGLRDVRNSGTLWRDYQEAAPLMFLLSRWEALWVKELPEYDIQIIDTGEQK